MTRDSDLDERLTRLVKEVLDEAPESAPSRLADLARLVEAWGARMNLSGHRTASEIADALIADALGVLAEIERFLARRVEGPVVDLGSGAGFPGLPIAIARPEVEVRLVEIREKRHLFQRAAIRELGLTRARAMRARIEDVATGEAPGEIVIAQAVGPIARVAPLMHPYLAPGGLAVIPGGRDLESPPQSAGLEAEIVDYRSPVRGQARRLWIARRTPG